MSTFHFQPIRGQAHSILRAIMQSPEVTACPQKSLLTLRLACEEIVVNMTSYAYPEGIDGFLDIDIRKSENRIIICFINDGIPFNPLEHQTPDLNLSWKQRNIGGLGIYLLTKKIDEVRYDYVDSKNVLTIEKDIKNL